MDVKGQARTALPEEVGGVSTSEKIYEKVKNHLRKMKNDLNNSDDIHIFGGGRVKRHIFKTRLK